jgi:hypothetical protein
MKKHILITGLLMIPSFICAQEFKEPDLDKLPILPGKVSTYYSKGCETKAKYLQELVQDAIVYFQNKLQDTFDIKLLVLNKSDWKLLVGGPYVLPDFAKNPDRIEMGINELFKIKLPENETLYGKDKAFLWDFIAIHELGHYISQHKKVKSIRWTSEFFADYIMICFLLEKIPDWKFPSSISAFFKYLPFKYKTLDDFGNYYSRMDPLNYSIYQAKFEELAINIVKKRGMNFMYDYIDRFTKDIDPPPDRNHLMELTVAEFQKMEPEIFNEWLLGMRKTYLTYLVFFILFAITIFVRFFDNSYRIFTNLGLKTKKRFRIFGVPTFSILSKVGSVENLKIKRKLKLIVLFRPVMYLCFTLIILLLILHH